METITKKYNALSKKENSINRRVKILKDKLKDIEKEKNILKELRKEKGILFKEDIKSNKFLFVKKHKSSVARLMKAMRSNEGKFYKFAHSGTISEARLEIGYSEKTTNIDIAYNLVKTFKTLFSTKYPYREK